MPTDSTVKFYNSKNKIILSVYRQYDGDDIGNELAEWLLKKKVIGNVGYHTMEDGFANGIECLAAQYVAQHKTQIGSFYLTTKNDKQQYNYEVRIIGDDFNIQVGGFSGTPSELLDTPF